jgi:hypothetical protein
MAGVDLVSMKEILEHCDIQTAPGMPTFAPGHLLEAVTEEA